MPSSNVRQVERKQQWNFNSYIEQIRVAKDIRFDEVIQHDEHFDVVHFLKDLWSMCNLSVCLLSTILDIYTFYSDFLHVTRDL